MRQGKRKAAAFIGATAALSVTFSSLTATAALANTDETDKQSQLSEVLAEHQLGPSQEPLVYSPDDPDFAEATEQLLKQVTNEQNQTEPAPQLPAGPVKTADVPDPLDFGSQPADPANYLIPASADRFKTGDGSYKIGRPTAGGPAAGAQVDGLADFYQQSIAWGSCKDFDPEGSNKYDRAGVECGYLIVPIDYKNPSGPTAAIALLKVPAKNQAEKIGTIFVDPGGPGGSGVSIAAGMSRAGGEVRDKFDIIGFDPRGVSSSLPMIRCKSSAAFDAQREGSDGLSADKQNQILKHNTDECYKNTGVAFGVNGENFIANVGTENVVRDLDIARAAVGDPKLNYLGFSYGTSIGYQYALKFPDNIRALVLDGVVNPLENNEEEAKKYEQYTANTGSGMSSELSQIQGFQETFEQFLKKCSAEGFDGKPCALGNSNDVPTLLAEYQKIAQKAWGGTTYSTTEATPRAVSFSDVNTGTILAMYADFFWPQLNDALAELRDNNTGNGIMALADNYYSRDSAGKYTFSDSAFQTISCTDNGTSEPFDQDAAVKKAAEYFKVAPFTDPGKNPDGTQRGLEPTYDWCHYYKVKGTLPQGQTLKAMPNILYISTTYDPATPYQDGIVGAAATGTTVLTVAGSVHTSYYPGNGDCAEEITNRYYVDLVVPTDITGDAGVETKDIYSNVITGNQCRVDSFRPVTTVESKAVNAGDTVDVAATGLVRNTQYTLELPAGYELVDPATQQAASAITSTVEGTAVFRVKVPAGAAAGDVPFNLLPADLKQNDPQVRAAGVLTITVPAAPGAGNDGGVKVPVPPADKADNGKPATAKQQTKANLARTGSDATAGLFVATAVMLAGAATLALARKRRSC